MHKGSVILRRLVISTGVSSEPPTLSLSFSPKRDGSKKDTLRNIEATGEFVVNSSSHAYLTQLTNLPPTTTTAQMKWLRSDSPPSLDAHQTSATQREAAVQMECKLFQLIPVGQNVLVLGTILVVHVSEAVLRGDRVDALALDPVSRLGGHFYGKTRDLVELSPAQAHGHGRT